MFRCSRLIILNTLFNQSKVSKKDAIKALYNVIFLDKIKNYCKNLSKELQFRHFNPREHAPQNAALQLAQYFTSSAVFTFWQKKHFIKSPFLKNNGYQHHYPHKTA